MVKYVYLRDSSSGVGRGFPVACVAFIKNGNTVEYSLSVYNPKDKFSKAMARKVAEGRLLNKTSSTVSLYEDESVASAVVAHLATLMLDPVAFKETFKTSPSRNLMKAVDLKLQYDLSV